MAYLHTEENEKIVEIINTKGACGNVTDLFDVLKLGDDAWAVIFEADGPQYGALIVDGDVKMSGGTGNSTGKELIIDYIRNGGEFLE